MINGWPKVGSLFSGVGGLDLGIQQLWPTARTTWMCEANPEARKVLGRRFPGVPIFHDITTIAWASVTPVDILAGGFPCQDVSAAGLRAGLAEGTRSGLWMHFAEGIGVLRPPLVVIENVKGLLTAKTDDPNVKAIDRVVADLAELGYDHRMKVQSAASVGAPHRRDRVFIVARPA